MQFDPDFMLGKLIEPELKAMLAEKRYKDLRQTLQELDPVDIAEIIQVLSPDEGIILFRILPRDLAADVYEYLPLHEQEDFLRLLSNEQIAAILNEMDPDDRTELLEELPVKISRQVLKLLSPDERKVATTLLGYPEESIGRLMTPEFMAIRENWTVKEAFQYIRTHGQDKESINILYVVDENDKLLDEILLKDLLFADPNSQISELMNRQVVSLLSTDDQETAADTMLRYDLSMLPVVDSDGALVGIVTNDDILDVVVEEATEDIHRMGGMEALEEPYLQVSFLTMLRKRAGWMAFLFLSGMVTVSVMSMFQPFIDQLTVLSIFIPLIISSGGNTGSQAATLVIRALAVQDIDLSDWFRVLGRECLMGLSMGAILGLVALLRVYYFPGAEIHVPAFLLSLTVSLSVLGVVTFGTLVGCMLPFILRSIGFDPALSSSPLVATCMDTLGVMIYFTIAIFILSRFLAT